MSFSKLDGPPPTKQEYIFHAGPLVLPLALVLQKPCQLQYPLVSQRESKPEKQKDKSRDHVLFKPHMAKQQTPQAQNHHCAAQHPQISLIMSVFCAKGMSNLVTFPIKVIRKYFVFITIIKVIKASWMVLIQSIIKCILCNLELKLVFLRCRSLL